MPEVVYKYRSATTSADLERIEDLIIRNRVYFGTSFGFNDLFDCRPAIDWSCTDEQFVYYGIKRLKKRKLPPGIKLNEVQTRADMRRRIGTEEDPRTPEGRVLAENMFWKMINGWGVFCVAERCDNILMWSHYAVSCTGVCFEIETSGFKHIAPIDYKTNRPVLYLADDKMSIQEILDRTFYIKSMDWKYEQEWPVLGPKGVSNLPPNAVKRVIFGPNCPNDIREKILAMIAKASNKLTAAEAIIDRDCYRFNIQNIS